MHAPGVLPRARPPALGPRSAAPGVAVGETRTARHHDQAWKRESVDKNEAARLVGLAPTGVSVGGITN